MLSGTAQENTPRPRPPRAGIRSRSYLKSKDTNTLPVSSPTLTFDEKSMPIPDQQHYQQQQHHQPDVACHALGAAIHLDQDLDLDLPPGLTAALSSTDRWSPSLGPSQGQTTITFPGGPYTGPRWGRGATRSSSTPGSDQTLDPPRRASTSPMRAPPNQEFHLARRGSHADMLTETLNAVAGRPAEPADPDEELDRAWLGGLPREELEALLFQANAVIQERERDLGIAAAIGQALLQKNTSLRRKHEEVMDRFHATTELVNEEYDHDEHEHQEASFERDPAKDQCPDTSDPPMYSPPPNDAEADTHTGGATPSTDDTPMPTPRATADYFQYASHTPDAQQPHFPRSPSSSSDQFNAGVISLPKPLEDAGFASRMIPSTSGLISSPSNSTIHSETNFSPEPERRHRQRHQFNMQASMTQKHLAALSAQNETLLEQMATLQEEAEEAKREGSRRLRRLNKEIKGLQLELENVTERNEALESTTRAPKKIWTRHQSAEGGEGSSASTRSPTSAPSPGVRPSHRSAASLHVSTSSESLSNSLQALLKDSPADESGSAEQHSVVARLLAKVKELEQTNAALEAARRDRDGRLGAALKEGTKITDEYDAVLHAHESELSFAMDAGARGVPGLHEDDKGSEASPDHLTSPKSPYSPCKSHSRALGNRWQVETRRTVRQALRRRRTAQEIWGSPTRSGLEGLPPSISDSSISSMLSASTMDSPFSSPRQPRRKKSALSLGRPRILITPSMEDLAAKSREQAEGWEDQRSDAAHVTGQPTPASPYHSPRSRSLDPSDAHAIVRRASDEALRARRQRELSNEAGKGTSTPVLQSPAGSPAWHAHATARAMRSRESSSGMNSQHPTTGGLPSLGSELGSMLDGDQGDETEIDPIIDATNTSLLRLYYDGDATMASYARDLTSEASATSTPAPTIKRHFSSRPTLRPKTSCESIAASDIANLRYEEDAKQREEAPLHDPSSQLLLLNRPSHHTGSIDEQLKHRIVSREGEWFYSVAKRKSGDSARTTAGGDDDNDDRVIASGSLRDRREPHEEQYSLLERVVYDHPVRWADDDDYGAPLKESEARRLGLLGPPAAAGPAPALARRTTLARGLLKWAGISTGRITSARERLGRKGRDASLVLSSEQLDAEERREALLRAKYHRALRLRGFETGDGDSVDELTRAPPEEANGEGEEALLEHEVNERAWALSNATGSGRRYGYAPRSEPTPRDYNQENGLPSTGPTPSSSTSSILSALTRRSSRRRNGNGGVSALVNLNASLATLHEVVAWAWLVCILIVAFFVSASRGEVSPRRILGTGETNRTRDRRGLGARDPLRKAKGREAERAEEATWSRGASRSPSGENPVAGGAREGARRQAATGGVQRKVRG